MYPDSPCRINSTTNRFRLATQLKVFSIKSKKQRGIVITLIHPTYISGSLMTHADSSTLITKHGSKELQGRFQCCLGHRTSPGSYSVLSAGALRNFEGGKEDVAMAAESCPSVMLITANVGSIFEDPEHMLKGWLQKFYESVQTWKPQLIAIHMQEVGGKDFEQCMGNVDAFVQNLIDSEALKSFDRTLVFLDKDFALVDQFTALGNLYFVHESLQNVQLYDFKTCKFNTIQGKQFVNLINKKTIYEKAKFPQDFFPGTVWSRKGFLRTRWNVENRIFDLANIHLFHDASNLAAMETFPSPYSKYRKRALEHVLQRFSKDKHDKVPLFLFGDFNFRLDSQGVIQALVAEAIPEYTKEDKNVKRITYKDRDGSSKAILILEKKRFEIDDPDKLIRDNAKWLLPLDKELLCFTNQLFEFDRDFPPSYPYSEDVTDGRSYMKTRVPAWCDRILLSKSAKALVKEDLYNKAMYSVIGQDICMGDHKPIFLSFRLAPTQGTPVNHKRSPAHKCCVVQ